MKYYAKFKSPDGEYVDSTGVRYDVSAVRRVRSPQGLNVGYVPFPSLEDALEYWGLVPVVPTEDYLTQPTE
jgi:hypothetical protein